jgi:hypothetical protein
MEDCEFADYTGAFYQIIEKSLTKVVCHHSVDVMRDRRNIAEREALKIGGTIYVLCAERISEYSLAGLRETNIPYLRNIVTANDISIYIVLRDMGLRVLRPAEGCIYDTPHTSGIIDCVISPDDTSMYIRDSRNSYIVDNITGQPTFTINRPLNVFASLEPHTWFIKRSVPSDFDLVMDDRIGSTMPLNMAPIGRVTFSITYQKGMLTYCDYNRNYCMYDMRNCSEYKLGALCKTTCVVTLL